MRAGVTGGRVPTTLKTAIKSRQRMRYQAYHLVIRSDLELPELTVQEDSGSPSDVHIRSGNVNPDGLSDGRQAGPFLWVSSTALWLQVPRVARFLVRNGTEILIDPEPGIDEDSIRLYLLSSAFAALLFQRGHFILRGDAIRVGDQCLACIGPSGVGKSTLAVALAKRGYPILADDLVVMDAQCRVLPSFPQIKLGQGTADRLDLDTSKLNRTRPTSQRFSIPVDRCGNADPIALRWVYILDTSTIDKINIEPIQGLRCFLPLRNHTYRVRFLESMGLKREHLKFCSQLAGRIRLARATRPSVGFALDEMIDAILTHTEANP